MNDLNIQIGKIVELIKEPVKVGKFYDLTEHKIEIDTPSGFKPVKSIILKNARTAEVKFDTGIIYVANNHIFITPDGTCMAEHLSEGDKVIHKDGVATVESVYVVELDETFYDLEVDSDEHIYFTADGLLHHNTGKTQTVEDTLDAQGLTDGNGYFKLTGSASPFGIYEMLYKNRKGIILFDDCDGALADQDGRNLIKAATDTKKLRKMAWSKKNSNLYDPTTGPPKKKGTKDKEIDIDNVDDEGDEEESMTRTDMIPSYFNFEGRIIFISNLPINKLDPDGALRTRAFIIAINPTKEEIFDRMGQIINSIKLEAGTLSEAERQEVLDVIKTSKKSEVSLRTLVRALNLASSGASNWKQLVKLYG